MARGLSADELRGLAHFLEQLAKAESGWRPGASSFLASAGEGEDELLVQVLWDDGMNEYVAAIQVNAAVRRAGT